MGGVFLLKFHAMKPKDLILPFQWGEQFITIENKVFFTFEPFKNKGADFAFPGWDHPEVFGNDKPVKIEYCSGNGKWIAERAAAEPEVNWVAVEKRLVRLRKVWAKMKNRGLCNLFSICGEALDATKRFLPTATVDEVYINFPDPWPKKKHAKYRLIQAPFLDELSRILKNGGTVSLVTDDADYSEQIIEVFSGHSCFESCYETPFYRNERDDYGSTSYFEDLWRSKGKDIRYHQFKKIGRVP